MKSVAPTPQQTKRSVDKWNPFTIRNILRNEIYVGQVYYGKTRVIDDIRIYQEKDKCILINMPELKIIEPEIQNKALERAQRNKELAKRNRKNEYLLSGFFRCGGCGATIVGHYEKTKRV